MALLFHIFITKCSLTVDIPLLGNAQPEFNQ